MGKKIPMWQYLIVIIAMLAFLLWEIVICQDEEGHLALICAAIVAAIVAVANGWKWNYLEQGIITAISRSMQAMLILMMVGLLIGSWIPGGIVDCTGIMATFAGVLLKVARGTRGGLVFMTIFSCIFVNAVCCDQYLAIILPGRMYKEAFEDMRLKPKNLSRCLEDAGTITSQFFPWNTCGATMKSFLGVDQWGKNGYGPYAILNWFNPIVSIIYGFTGISMEKMTEEEYQKVLKEREEEKKAALEALGA